MVFVYVELLVLLVLAFLLGAGAASLVIRTTVRRTPGQVSAYVAEPEARR